MGISPPRTFLDANIDFTDEDESTAELHRRLKVLRVGRFLHDVLGCSSEYLATLERRTWTAAGTPFWEG